MNNSPTLIFNGKGAYKPGGDVMKILRGGYLILDGQHLYENAVILSDDLYKLNIKTTRQRLILHKSQDGTMKLRRSSVNNHYKGFMKITNFEEVKKFFAKRTIMSIHLELPENINCDPVELYINSINANRAIATKMVIKKKITKNREKTKRAKKVMNGVVNEIKYVPPLRGKGFPGGSNYWEVAKHFNNLKTKHKKK